MTPDGASWTLAVQALQRKHSFKPHASQSEGCSTGMHCNSPPLRPCMLSVCLVLHREGRNVHRPPSSCVNLQRGDISTVSHTWEADTGVNMHGAMKRTFAEAI